MTPPATQYKDINIQTKVTPNYKFFTYSRLVGFFRLCMADAGNIMVTRFKSLSSERPAKKLKYLLTAIATTLQGDLDRLYEWSKNG